MITKSTGYQSSDGVFHATLEDAQKHELGMLFKESDHPDQVTSTWDITEIVGQILAFKGKIIDILTMKPNSLPKARKINGGRKVRTPRHIAEQFALPLSETPAKATA